jgi:hypothetical protein
LGYDLEVTKQEEEYSGTYVMSGGKSESYTKRIERSLILILVLDTEDELGTVREERERVHEEKE